MILDGLRLACRCQTLQLIVSKVIAANMPYCLKDLAYLHTPFLGNGFQRGFRQRKGH